ncbi:Transcription factor TGA2 [Ananas comosus]|uniref:Transcription factor TGA2 n=1 Tax=Ananas comosus TaxID=4615 RepID=A0A199W182_ANACO|nr:Transcription factor TGA2 [Ananas comosus]
MDSDPDAGRYFAAWFGELRSLRRDLRSARFDPDRARLAPLVDRALAHYDAYYRARSELARSDPVGAFTTPWATPVERGVAFWVAGFRPTTFVQLLYTESGRRFEARLEDFLLGAGARSGDLGDLSPVRVDRIDELHRRTVREEDEIGEEMDRIQEGEGLDVEGSVDRIERVMGRADALRMRTLRGLVGLLNPVQAAELLVALADLEIGLREYGLEHEHEHERVPDEC